MDNPKVFYQDISEDLYEKSLNSQLIFTYPESTIKTLERGVN